jgi:hypothetical protein
VTWWDTFTNWWEEVNKPAYTSDEWARTQKVMKSEKFKELQANLNKNSQSMPMFFAAEKAISETYGADSPTMQNFQAVKGLGVQAPMEALTAPARVVAEQIGGAALAATTGKSFWEARDLVRGERKEGLPFFYSGTGGVSLGQSLWGLRDRVLPGQQGTEELDWTNRKKVQKYFSEGPQKYITGTTDAVASVALDPTVWFGVGAAKFRVKYVVNPLNTAEKRAKAVLDIDSAVAGQKSKWSSAIDYYMENPSEMAIINHSTIFESTAAQPLAGAIAYYARRGDREMVGNILKVAVGDEVTKEQLLARKDLVSGYLSNYEMMAADKTMFNNLPKGKKKQVRESIEEAVNQLQKETDALTSAAGFRDPLTGEIRNVGSAYSLTRSVSRIDAVERARVFAAKTRSGAGYFYGHMPLKGNMLVRTVTWLNPSGLIKEAPAGIFDLTGVAAKDSYKELLAITRKVNASTGKDYTARMNEYISLSDEASRAKFLDDFEKEVVSDLVQANIRSMKSADGTLRKLTEDEVEYVGILVDRIMTQHRNLQSRAFAAAARKNFFVYDEVSKETFQYPQLKELLERQAASKNLSVDEYLKQIETNPQFGSQAVNTHIFIDTVELDRLIKQNVRSIGVFLENVDVINETLKANAALTGGKVSKSVLRKEVSREIDGILKRPSVSESRADSFTGAMTQVQGSLVKLADDFYANFWKPVTLLSPKYGIRNVLEGTNRTLVYLSELADMTGVSKREVYGDWLAGTVEPLKVVKANRELKAQGRKAVEAAGGSSRVLAAARAQTAVVRTTTSSASLSASKMKTFAERFITIEDIPGSTKNASAVARFLSGKTKSLRKIKSEEAKRFLLSFLNGDIDDAIKILNATDDVSSLTYQISIFRDMIRTAGADLDKDLRAKLYDNFLVDTQVAIVKDYSDALLATAEGLDRVIASRAAEAAAWGEYDLLLKGSNPILRRKGDGTFEVTPGNHVPDYGAGQIGIFALAETAADRTYANALLSGSRLIGEDALSATIDNVAIRPDNANWGRAYVDFINKEVLSDAVMYRVLDGATLDDTIKFLKSDVGRNYRRQIGVGVDDIQNHAELLHAKAEYYLPEIPNAPEGMLKKMAINGEITVDNIDRIPVEYRPSVIGKDMRSTQRSNTAMRIWREKIINPAFKYVGTLPETTLSRHPFYKAAYRAEARRVGRLLESQGVDLTSKSAIDQITRAAHSRARKELDQTLYTIARRTDPAQFLRFVSPFYSAQQNSARFWLGQAYKRPALVPLGLAIWNTPNKILNVIDENGESVESSLPFFANERIMLTLPEPVAKFFGQDFLTVNKTSMDLITNGQVPLIPQLSGAMVSLPFNAIMNNTGLQATLTEMGMPADFFEKTVFPYMDVQSTSLVQQLLPMPAWLRGAINAGGGTQQAAARTNLVIERKLYEMELNGETITDKKFAKIIKDASSQSQKSYVLETLFSLGSPFSTKLTNEMQLYKYEYYRYIEEHGPIEGPLKAAEDMGNLKYVYAASTMTENPGGLMSTPQTERNLKAHMDLASELVNMGEDSMKLLGLLFNEGEAGDYSPLVSKRLYDTSISGAPLKSKSVNFADSQAERQESLGWSYYIPFKEELTAIAAAKGVAPGTNEWDATYKPALDKVSALLAERYPAWDRARGVINTKKTLNTIKAMNVALNNKKFMDSVGKRKPVWEAIGTWMEYRDQLSNVLATRGTKAITETGENADLFKAREAIAEVIASQYPDFAYIYERFLRNDPLTKVG